MTPWETATQWEAQWWGRCLNTFEEEEKQKTYMHRMGYRAMAWNGMLPVWDFQGLRVLDVGGGPCSVLLKGINLKVAAVVDPCPYPDWVMARYREAGIMFEARKGEDIDYPPGAWDVGLLYNCLQHVEDPERIVHNMRRCCKLLRVFEFLNIGLCDGHIQVLTEDAMNGWLGGRGYTEDLPLPTFGATAYYGAFAGGIS